MKLEEAATGPFAQFQNSPDEEDAITGLVLQLIRRHPQADPRDEAVRRQVKAFRDSIADMLKDRKKDTTPTPKPEDTSVAKFFEEIKVLVRDVPERVALEVNGSVRGMRGKRRFRLHPAMMEELLYHPAIRESDNAVLLLLIVFSMFRDDFPWLYELAAQLSRAVERGDRRGIEATHRSIHYMVEMLQHSPIGDMLGVHDDESMMMMHTLMRMTERYLPELTAPRRTAEPKSTGTGKGTNAKGKAKPAG